MKLQAKPSTIEHHGDQRYGEHPYAVNLDAVAGIAEPFGQTAVTIASLHDMVNKSSQITQPDIVLA